MRRKRYTLYLVILAMLLAGMITGQGFFFHIGYLFIAVVMFAFLWAWSGPNWLQLSRQTRARRAQVGRYMEERFAIQNAGPLLKFWIEVYDESDLPLHRASRVITRLGAGRTTIWGVRTLCVRRGSFRLGPLRVMAADPFGLFEMAREAPATSQLIVYPWMVEITGFAQPYGILPGGDALRRRVHHITTNVSGVRDYAPGDSFNRIHWKSTARRDRLISKEFELDPLADVWIVMDSERTVHAGKYERKDDEGLLPWEDPTQYKLPPTTEEYAITTASSLARFFLGHDRAVGFVTYTPRRECVQVDRGSRQLRKILEMLAVVEIGGHVTLDQVLSMEGDLLGRGATVVVITPSTRETWVAAAQRLLRRGLRVIAVLVDVESFGGRPGSQNIEALLATMGIPVYRVANGDDLSAALSQRLA
jgi:uncharacterized protein (DUF58 family)